MSDGMKDLHWLKIPQCIQFKVLVTIYQCVNGVAPPFGINLLDLNLTKKNFLHKSSTAQTDRQSITHVTSAQPCTTTLKLRNMVGNFKKRSITLYPHSDCKEE